MDKRIKEIIEELRVTIMYDPNIDDSGHYIAAYNIVVLYSTLNEYEMTKTLLHELGHAAKHQKNEALYCATFAMHAKMENEADEFMIRHLVRQYMELPEANPSTVNYLDFIEKNSLSMNMAPIVREAFLEFGQ